MDASSLARRTRVRKYLAQLRETGNLKELTECVKRTVKPETISAAGYTKIYPANFENPIHQQLNPLARCHHLNREEVVICNSLYEEYVSIEQQVHGLLQTKNDLAIEAIHLGTSA